MGRGDGPKMPQVTHSAWVGEALKAAILVLWLRHTQGNLRVIYPDREQPILNRKNQ